MKRLTSYLSATLAVFIMSIGMASPLVAADSTTQSSGAGSSGLSITPRRNFIIEPGKSVTDKLSIGNLDQDSALSINLRLIDFTYTDQTGTPKLDLAADASPTPWSLRPFTTLPKSVLVPAGGTKTISYTITIPKNQGAGSYYSAILYQAGGGNGGNVALNASGVTLAFVSVPGQVKENMTLQKLGAYTSEDNGTTGSFTFIATNGTPKMVAFTLKNNGNVFESPAGDVIIKDIFGHQVANVTTNATSSLALLGQTRLFTSCIKTVQQKIELEGGTTKNTTCVDPGLKPGRYTASLDTFYGQNGNQTHEITATATFWVLPWWFIITCIVVLILLVVGIWWLQRKIKRVVRGTAYKDGRHKRRH